LPEFSTCANFRRPFSTFSITRQMPDDNEHSTFMTRYQIASICTRRVPEREQMRLERCCDPDCASARAREKESYGRETHRRTMPGGCCHRRDKGAYLSACTRHRNAASAGALFSRGKLIPRFGDVRFKRERVVFAAKDAIESRNRWVIAA